MFRDGQLLAVVGEQVDMKEDVEMTEAIAEERMRWKRTEDWLLLVPEEHQEAILREHHDSMVAGHWGAARTIEFISRNYYQQLPIPKHCIIRPSRLITLCPRQSIGSNSF